MSLECVVFCLPVVPVVAVLGKNKEGGGRQNKVFKIAAQQQFKAKREALFVFRYIFGIFRLIFIAQPSKNIILFSSLFPLLSKLTLGSVGQKKIKNSLQNKLENYHNTLNLCL